MYLHRLLTMRLAIDFFTYLIYKIIYIKINFYIFNRFRCIFMMVLPQLFSDKGRHALLMYAFILSFSGPSKTTLHNTGVLSESLTCLQVWIDSTKIISINNNLLMYPNWMFQDEIKSAIRQIVELIKKPLLAVRSSITRIKADLAVIINKMKKGMLAVKNTVTELGEDVNNYLVINLSCCSWVLHTNNNCYDIIKIIGESGLQWDMFINEKVK